MEEVKKADVFGDVIVEGKPLNGDAVTLTLPKAFAVKLGKSVAKIKCDTIPDLVKAKDSLNFLKTLHGAGIDYAELELSPDITNFLDTYL